MIPIRPYEIAWLVEGLILLLVPITVVVLRYGRLTEAGDKARLLRRAGTGFTFGFALLFGVFLVGETLADPGGWRGVSLVSTWLVPLVIATIVAWRKPEWGVDLLGALTVAVVALSVWTAFDQSIRDLEDRVGPFTLVALFAVAIPVGILGRSMPREAGAMLVILGLVPGLFSTISSVAHGPGSGLLVIGAPIVISGILYLASDRVASKAVTDNSMARATEFHSKKRGTTFPIR